MGRRGGVGVELLNCLITIRISNKRAKHMEPCGWRSALILDIWEGFLEEETFQLKFERREEN